LVVMPRAEHEHRDGAVRQYLNRLAAEYYGRDPAPTVRGHDDQITILLGGNLDDRLIGLLVHDMKRLADEAGCGGDLTCGRKVLGGQSVRIGLISLRRLGD